MFEKIVSQSSKNMILHQNEAGRKLKSNSHFVDTP